MPCYRCGTRQVDPDRGESPWKRGVRGDRQVLICPGCQTAHDWMADLDRCPVCASVRLVRRLGEAECRDCGAVRPPVASALPGHLAALARSGRAVAGRPGAEPGGGQAGGGQAGGGQAGPGGAEPGGPGGVGSPGSPAGAGGPGGPDGPEAGSLASEAAAMQGLAEEVEQALARVLGRTAGSAASG
jgi:hypothetical protein